MECVAAYRAAVRAQSRDAGRRGSHDPEALLCSGLAARCAERPIKPCPRGGRVARQAAGAGDDGTEILVYPSPEADAGRPRRRRFWTDHGSTRYLWTDESVHDAARYVLFMQ